MKKVLGALGISASEFYDYLNQGASFYDGTHSAAPMNGTLVFGSLREKYAGISISEHFNSGEDPDFANVPKRSPLTVFANPASINTTDFGANLQNKAALFHEALHGLKGFRDPDLQNALMGRNATSFDTAYITDFIKYNCS